ncbi:MAG: RNA methyltransferase [Nitrosopumilus sp. H13]|nr:MAG: RNA methyltransferase [Nitrosopumilus sp. H13]
MHFEEHARDEMLGILEWLGDAEGAVEITRYTGLLTARTALDPVEVVARARQRLLEEPWSIRYCLRMVPIQRTVQASMEDIIGESGFVAGMIPEGMTYKIYVKKRGSDISGTNLIREMASRIPNGVRMNHPDRVVLVEIIQASAGIAVLREEDVLSMHGVKRSLSE